MHNWGNKSQFPYVVTVFSAPNYCGSYDNKAAVLVLKNNNLHVKQYKEVDAPYRLPIGTNLISWSIPFIVEKVTSMLYAILKVCSQSELDQDDKTIVAVDVLKNET